MSYSLIRTNPFLEIAEQWKLIIIIIRTIYNHLLLIISQIHILLILNYLVLLI